MKSLHIIISGRVQGVSFRYYTYDKARELDLKGYVKNMKNGAVEIKVEGSLKDIKELLEFLKNNPGSSRVESIRINKIDKIDYEDFKIEY